MRYELPTGRPAAYAYRFQDRLWIWQPQRLVLKQLSELTQLRQRLQSAINQLSVPLAEQKSFCRKDLHVSLKHHYRASLRALKDDLDHVEARIEEIIKNDKELETLFSLRTSVPGVGTVVATKVILAAGERAAAAV